MGNYYEVVQQLQSLNEKVDTINSTLGGISVNSDLVSEKIVIIVCCSLCMLICLGVLTFIKKGWFR